MVNAIQFGILMPIPIFQPPLQATVLPLLAGELQSLDVTNPGLHVAQILLGDLTVSIQTQPGRVDLTVFKPNEPSAPFNLEMNVDEGVAAVGHAVVEIGRAIGATRLAMITWTAALCDSPEQVTSHILAHTNGMVLPAGTIDVDVRVNVRLQQDPTAVPINRIIRWQGLNQNVVPAVDGGANTEGMYAAVCQIDVNSAPDALLTPELIAPTFDLIVAASRPLISGSWGAL